MLVAPETARCYRPCMGLTVKEWRQKRLRHVLEKAFGGNQARLAQLMDWHPSYITSLLHWVPGGKDKRYRAMGDRTARSLEQKLEMVPNQFDQPFDESDNSTTIDETLTRAAEPDVDYLPPSHEELEMEREIKGRLLLQAWQVLPQNEQDEVLREVNARSMRYRSPIDKELPAETWAAPGSPTAIRAAAKRAVAAKRIADQVAAAKSPGGKVRPKKPAKPSATDH